MRVAVTGSIATDHLMSFPGRFAEQILPEEIARLSLSFLVDDLDVRRGGVAANISFGLGLLGLRPVLVGAVGDDFADYRSWLEAHGVDTASVWVSKERRTARFVCTTDADQNQIASFYPGAMTEAADIELAPVAERLGGLDLVVVGANDPVAMTRHTDECRRSGYPFAADPSQQLARMDGDEVRRLIDGAAYLFSNAYERALIESKTGWGPDEVVARVGVRVTTHGAGGVVVERAGRPDVRVPAVPADVADPTGGGDAFRAGFLAGLAWALDAERAAQVGVLVATMAVEGVGPQGYGLDAGLFNARLSKAFGDDAAAEVAPLLQKPPPVAGSGAPVE